MMNQRLKYLVMGGLWIEMVNNKTVSMFAQGGVELDRNERSHPRLLTMLNHVPMTESARAWKKNQLYVVKSFRWYKRLKKLDSWNYWLVRLVEYFMALLWYAETAHLVGIPYLWCRTRTQLWAAHSLSFHLWSSKFLSNLQDPNRQLHAKPSTSSKGATTLLQGVWIGTLLNHHSNSAMNPMQSKSWRASISAIDQMIMLTFAFFNSAFNALSKRL